MRIKLTAINKKGKFINGMDELNADRIKTIIFKDVPTVIDVTSAIIYGTEMHVEGYYHTVGSRYYGKIALLIPRQSILICYEEVQSDTLNIYDLYKLNRPKRSNQLF